MQSSRKHTPPRSGHTTVQTILTKFAKVRYNSSHSANKLPVKQLGATTSLSVSAVYLWHLSKDSRKDQKYYASLKKEVKA